MTQTFDTQEEDITPDPPGRFYVSDIGLKTYDEWDPLNCTGRGWKQPPWMKPKDWPAVAAKFLYAMRRMEATQCADTHMYRRTKHLYECALREELGWDWRPVMNHPPMREYIEGIMAQQAKDAQEAAQKRPPAAWDKQ